MAELAKFPLDISVLMSVLTNIEATNEPWSVAPEGGGGNGLTLQGDGTGGVLVIVEGPDW